jgi:hypothetical protein
MSTPVNLLFAKRIGKFFISYVTVGSSRRTQERKFVKYVS